MNRQNRNKYFLAVLYCAVLLGLVVSLATVVSMKAGRKKPPSTWKCGQVDLMFNSRIDDKEAYVSEDLKPYLGWIFISQEVGALHITDIFYGYKNCICIKGDPFSRKPRKIYAVIISQEALKENFGLVLRKKER